MGPDHKIDAMKLMYVSIADLATKSVKYYSLPDDFTIDTGVAELLMKKEQLLEEQKWHDIWKKKHTYTFNFSITSEMEDFIKQLYFGTHYSAETHGGLCGTGSSHISSASTMPVIREMLPDIDSMEATHPVTGDYLHLTSIIMNLNDVHGWTREAIADWLDTLDHDLTLKG